MARSAIGETMTRPRLTPLAAARANRARSRAVWAAQADVLRVMVSAL